MHSLVVIDASNELSPLATLRLEAQIRAAGAQARVFKNNIELLDFLASSIHSQRLAVIDSRLITSQVVIDAVVKSPDHECRALVEQTRAPHPDSAARVAHKKIQSAASTMHRVAQPNHNLLGAVTLASNIEVSDAVRTTINYAKTLKSDFNAVDLLVVGLVRCAIDVSPIEATGVTVRATGDFQSAISEVDAQNDEALRLKRALRSNDGFYSTFVLRKLSSVVTRIAIKRGWTPNGITLASLFISLFTAGLFATGNHTALIVGAILVQLSIVVDCSDGEVARYTGVSSQLGAWLDASTDRVKEYAIYAGLAFGAVLNGQSLWGWAATLVVLQTVRHLSDYNFVAVRGIRESTAVRLPLNQVNDAGVRGAGSLLDKSAALNTKRWIYWIKRVIYLPIGERWLVISVGAALGSPALVFYVLFGLGMFGLVYVSYGRFMRSSRWTHPRDRSGCDLVERQLDFGPMFKWFIADNSHPLRGRYGWAAPSILRFIELACIALVGQSQPWAYLMLFAVAFHHYDTMYRSLAGNSFPQRLTDLGLGFEGRIVLVLVTGFGLILPALWWFVLLGLYFSAVLVVIPSRQWISELKAK